MTAFELISTFGQFEAMGLNSRLFAVPATREMADSDCSPTVSVTIDLDQLQQASFDQPLPTSLWTYVFSPSLLEHLVTCLHDLWLIS